VINVSRNNLSGELPGELSKLVLKRFLANDKHFIGRIPDFNLSEEVEKFSVSNNNLTGPIPHRQVLVCQRRRYLQAAGLRALSIVPVAVASAVELRLRVRQGWAEQEQEGKTKREKDRHVHRVRPPGRRHASTRPISLPQEEEGTTSWRRRSSWAGTDATPTAARRRPPPRPRRASRSTRCRRRPSRARRRQEHRPRRRRRWWC
jgi:hypothetical protein